MPRDLSSDEEEDDDPIKGTQEAEDEVEPMLKYSRLSSAAVSALLAKDAAKCIVAHEKFLLIGTQLGNVYILDLIGGELVRNKIACHTQAINDMSLDDTGELVATCSNDGTVVISDLWSDSTPQSKYQYTKAVNAIALAANFKVTQSFAVGGQAQQLILSSKTWLSSREKILHSGEGPITTIRWNGDYLAWANSAGVKIYDCNAFERITSVNRSQTQGQGEASRCFLAWANKDTLLIGWGSSVRVGVVKQKVSESSNPSRFFQIVSVFHTGFNIYGLAPFGEQQIAFLTRATESADQKASDSVEFHVLTWSADEIINDSISMDLKGCLPNSISLQFLWRSETPETKPAFFIMAPQDLVVARSRDLDDHIQWLVERGKIEQALEAAEANPQGLNVFSLSEIAHHYFDELFARGEYKIAAANCPRLLKKNVELWEKRIALFAQHRQLQVVAEFIPTSNPRLAPFIYELVLNEFCLEDPKGLLTLINKWSVAEGEEEVYDVNAVMQVVQERLARLEQDLTITTNRSLTVEDLQAAKQMKQRSTEYILEVLAILYVKTKRFAEAVGVKLRLGSSDLFDLVRNLKLFDTIKDKVERLMNFNGDKAAELFVDNVDVMPLESVVAQLSSHPRHLHKYLHHLFLKDKNFLIGYAYHNKQVELYAEYQPKFLLEFLKTSNQYLPEDAVKVCKAHHLYEEMAYLFQLMGDRSRALKILVLDVKDVQKTIDYVEGENKDELWEELITLSLDRPEFLSDLLGYVGSHYMDMARLIPRIPNELDIPNLRNNLKKVFADQQAQIVVREGCNRILREDCRSLQSRYYAFQQQAWAVSRESRCEKCFGSLLSRRERDRDSVYVFACSHVYHAQCIEPYRKDRSDPIMCIQCFSGHSHQMADD